ncbi:hypothetical protein QF031_002187 [Pseudarthrobacter defluvii]|nr:hypothetical protein [Pseudarthrobacter defluvii]
MADDPGESADAAGEQAQTASMCTYSMPWPD